MEPFMEPSGREVSPRVPDRRSVTPEVAGSKADQLPPLKGDRIYGQER
jgi:hypothetical protein